MPRDVRGDVARRRRQWRFVLAVGGMLLLGKQTLQQRRRLGEYMHVVLLLDARNRLFL